MVTNTVNTKVAAFQGNLRFSELAAEQLERVGVDMRLNLLQPLIDVLPPTLDLAKAELFADSAKFSRPFLVTEHHVRIFFSKLQRGVFAVQKYAGKSCNSPQELVDYFANVVGVGAMGPSWLFDIALEDASAGIAVVGLRNEADAKEIKRRFGRSACVVSVYSGALRAIDPPYDLGARWKDETGKTLNVSKKFSHWVKRSWAGETAEIENDSKKVETEDTVA